MNIYTIYASFLLLCGFCLCMSVFADFIFISSSTCNWKMLRGHVDQRSLQRRPKITQHRQNPWPKFKHQRNTKCSGAGANGPSWTDPTTARGGRCTTGYSGFYRFYAAFRFPVRFFWFLPL